MKHCCYSLFLVIFFTKFSIFVKDPVNAHQCWKLDARKENAGFLHAFHCSDTKFACTLGMQAGVCTYAMTAGTPIEQAGVSVKGIDGTWYVGLPLFLLFAVCC